MFIRYKLACRPRPFPAVQWPLVARPQSRGKPAGSPCGDFGTDTPRPPPRFARPRRRRRTIVRGRAKRAGRWGQVGGRRAWRGRARGRERSEQVWWGRCRSRSPRRGKRAGRRWRVGSRRAERTLSGFPYLPPAARGLALLAGYVGQTFTQGPADGFDVWGLDGDNDLVALLAFYLGAVGAILSCLHAHAAAYVDVR